VAAWWQGLLFVPGRFFGAVLLVGAIFAAQPPAELDLRDPGLVLMLRHARAPGTGDPQGFDLSDCSTQRNLDVEGRAQARRMGERLRASGIATARVFTSEWCRCRETAVLLGLGEPEPLPALNSFFAAPREREARMEALTKFLAGLPVDGGLVVLVTHQVTITELTGVYPASGDGVILRLDGTGRPPVAGRWRSP
jgi:broad specificity phosphatase PhoE